MKSANLLPELSCIELKNCFILRKQERIAEDALFLFFGILQGRRRPAPVIKDIGHDGFGVLHHPLVPPENGQLGRYGFQRGIDGFIVEAGRDFSGKIGGYQNRPHLGMALLLEAHFPGGHLVEFPIAAQIKLLIPLRYESGDHLMEPLGNLLRMVYVSVAAKGDIYLILPPNLFSLHSIAQKQGIVQLQGLLAKTILL